MVNSGPFGGQSLVGNHVRQPRLRGFPIKLYCNGYGMLIRDGTDPAWIIINPDINWGFTSAHLGGGVLWKIMAKY